MIHVGLTDALEAVATRRRDYPLHGDSLDWVARSLISRAVPHGARIPTPEDSTRARMATGSPELQHPTHDTARAAYEAIYRALCEEK